jgi:hypothetical protein
VKWAVVALLACYVALARFADSLPAPAEPAPPNFAAVEASLFQWAIERKELGVVRRMVEVQPRLVTDEALVQAICSSNEPRPEIISLLLSRGANPNSTCRDGSPLLMHALNELDNEVAVVLVFAGARTEGGAAMRLAADQGMNDVVEMILRQAYPALWRVTGVGWRPSGTVASIARHWGYSASFESPAVR